MKSRQTQAAMLYLIEAATELVAWDNGHHGALPTVSLDYRPTQPGRYWLEISALDTRPGWVRLVAPVSQEHREEVRKLLRWVAEILSISVQLVPPITLAEDIRISSVGDADGFATLVLNNSRTYRVPAFMHGMFDDRPDLVQAVTSMMQCLLLPGLRSVVIVRDPLDPELRQEEVITLTPEFHQRVLRESYDSLAAKVVFVEAPLTAVLTQHKRRQMFDPGISGLQRPQ
ncbi:hypothetical protein [Kocuria sp.]|uniref:hypothetical protein n=1 Tax=Kocuria sp. TaxID=1871328 RepID=UPI0026E0B37E|nr:hypothetical protein [Kocuria sp.]MDO5617817.1 hypothetical protein [Kocuria sp.]